MRVWALQAALERIAALLIAYVARHIALLAPCPAPQTNPHHPHTHMKTALLKNAQLKYLLQRMKRFPTIQTSQGMAWDAVL
jgi:hypothetical protein